MNELDLHTGSRAAAFCRRCAKWCQLLGIWRLEPHCSLAELLSTRLKTSSYWLSFSAASRATIRRCLLPDRTCKWRSLTMLKTSSFWRMLHYSISPSHQSFASSGLIGFSVDFVEDFAVFVWWGKKRPSLSSSCWAPHREVASDGLRGSDMISKDCSWDWHFLISSLARDLDETATYRDFWVRSFINHFITFLNLRLEYFKIARAPLIHFYSK